MSSSILLVLNNGADKDTMKRTHYPKKTFIKFSILPTSASMNSFNGLEAEPYVVSFTAFGPETAKQSVSIDFPLESLIDLIALLLIFKIII